MGLPVMACQLSRRLCCAGGSDLLMGLCIACMCAAEVPIFHYTDRLFEIVPVPVALHVVLGIYILRLLLYAGAHMFCQLQHLYSYDTQD